MANHPATAAFTQSAFDIAVKEFRDALPNRGELELRDIETLDDLWKEIKNTQEEHGRTGNLRNMEKIRPFLDCLEQYSSVIEQFVQVKPNVLALIWVIKID